MPLWTPDQPFLDDSFPLPVDQPFTRRQAVGAGLTDRHLRQLVACGLLRRMLKPVYVAGQVVDTVLLRAQALAFVVPGSAVVTDWTACWLWTGIDAPGAHERAPELYLFNRTPHTRLRNDLAISGARRFSPGDLAVVHGIAVTSPLRTACDIGRLFHRDRAIGALDALLRHGTFGLDQLLLEVERFRGMRGVRQLRALAPLADPRAESPGESTLRLRWLDEPSLPPPTPQVSIVLDGVEVYRIDLGVPEIRYGCEYDGAAFHGPAERKRDRERRDDLRWRFRWDVDAARRHNVFGPTRDVEEMLHAGVRRSRLALGLPAWPNDAA